MDPYSYDTVGESYRKKNNGDIIRFLGYPELDNQKWFKKNTEEYGYWEKQEFYTNAVLKLEPTNKSDRYAVMVLINNKQVSYVPRKYSKQLNAIIKKTGKTTATVPACIGYDGQYDYSIYNSYFSVALDMTAYLKKNKAKIPGWYKDSTLPMG